MKILFIDNCYPDFIAKMERGLAQKQLTSYASIKNYYYNQLFGTSDYYSKNMNDLGWQAEDVIINFNLLQSAWSKKNAPFNNLVSQMVKRTPGLRNYYAMVGNPLVLIDQAKRFRPDIIYAQCIGSIHPMVAKILKRYCKLFVGQIAAKLPPDNFFTVYDLILSSLPNIVDRMRSLGINSELLKIAFEKDILKQVVHQDRQYSVTHVGGYGPIHNERNLILEFAASHINIDFWGYGAENLLSGSPIRRNYHGEAWGVDMYTILANSKITLTGHIKQVADNYANNMTLFEATGCGTLLITDYKKNLPELFKIDEEVVTYKNPGELVQKINYYLNHEQERKKIAEAGQKRTLETHTYTERIKELKIILSRYYEQKKS